LIALPGVWSLGRFVENQLFGVHATDWPTALGASVLVALVAIGRERAAGQARDRDQPDRGPALRVGGRGRRSCEGYGWRVSVSCPFANNPSQVSAPE
jgi:hypothetical protein